MRRTRCGVVCECGSEADRHEEARLRKGGGLNYKVWYTCSRCEWREQKKLIERARRIESRRTRGAA